MTTPLTYIVPGEKSSPKFGRAFAAGCRGRVDASLTLKAGPVALFASPPAWNVLRPAMAQGRDFYYGDHGYFGRGTYFRVTKNAYQHTGIGAARTPERWRRFGRAIRPWRADGRHIVVCPNSPIFCGLHGFDVHAWIADVIRQLSRVTDREIRVRWKTDERTRPLLTDLDGAWALVTYSSAAAIWALIEGVPVFTLAPWAASARMGLADLSRIEDPVYPDDRESFVTVLANHQWTLDEIQHGLAWRVLQAEENCVAA